MAAIARPPAPPTPRRFAAGAAVAAAAVTALVAVPQPAGAAAPVERTTVPLAVSGKTLKPWSRLVMRPGAEVRFRSIRRTGTVLQLSDRPGRAGYVAVSARLGSQTAVGSVAKINLTRQRLGRRRARAVMIVDGEGGNAIQAGVIRLKSGQLRWAVWRKTRANGRSGLRVSRSRAVLRRWYRVQLTTRWGTAGAPVVLKVDGRVVVRVQHDLSGVTAQRATLGFGRPSSANETGTLLVRSAAVKTARGLAAPPGPAGPGGGASPSPAPAGATLPPPSTIPGRVLRTADFETGDLSQFNSVQRVASDRIQVVRDPVRAGGFAGRFEVRQGDDPLSGNYGDRAELSVDTNESEGQERWYSWSTMVGTDVPSTARFQVISQWHSRADGRPPVAFFAENDNLLLMVHPHRAPGDQISFVRAWTGPLRRGQWQDIQMHVRWSGSDSVGFIELWIDGARQRFSDGSTTLRIRTMYPGISNYFKQGYYRDNTISGTGTVYHDNFRMSEPG